MSHCTACLGSGRIKVPWGKLVLRERSISGGPKYFRRAWRSRNFLSYLW